MRRALAAAILTASCGGASVTGPDHHPNELLIEAYARCHAGHHHITVSVAFSDERRAVGDDYAKGWAEIAERRVTFYRPWVREQDPAAHHLEMVAAHEVCHVVLLTTSEPAADRCATIAYRDAGCRE